MATPTVSSSATASGQITLSQLTVSYTSNTDPLYVVFVNNQGVTFNPMTYNGVAMWLQSRFTLAGPWTVEVWTLDAPASGAHNIAGVQSALTFAYGLAAFNANGAAAPRVVPLAFTTAAGTSTAPSVTVTNGRTGDLVLEFCISDVNGQTFTDGAGQTRIATENPANTRPHIAFSSEPGAASVTGSFTLGTSDAWAMLGIVLADPAGAATVGRVSRLVAEVANDGTKTLRASRLVVEVANDGTRRVRVSRLVIEVITVHRFPALTLYR